MRLTTLATAVLFTALSTAAFAADAPVAANTTAAAPAAAATPATTAATAAVNDKAAVEKTCREANKTDEAAFKKCVEGKEKASTEKPAAPAAK